MVSYALFSSVLHVLLVPAWSTMFLLSLLLRGITYKEEEATTRDSQLIPGYPVKLASGQTGARKYIYAYAQGGRGIVDASGDPKRNF